MKIGFSEGVVVKEHKNIGLLINTGQARYRKLNKSGHVIAKLIQEHHSISTDDLLEKLSAYYGIPKDMMADDVNKFLDELVESDFIVSDSSSKESDSNNTVNNVTNNGIWIKVTNRCNLKCTYCYAESGINDNTYELTVNEIDNLLKSNDEPYDRIIITGGEPLIRDDILGIIRVCKKYGKVQLLTNGTLGDRDLYVKILELVDAIQISIDSYEKNYHDKNRGVGSFERAVKNARLICQLDSTKLALAMTPTPQSMPDIVEMIKFCIEMGVYRLHINRFVPYGRAKNYEDTFGLKEFYEWVDKGYDYIYESYISHYKQNRQFNFYLDVASDLTREVYSIGKKYSCGLNCNILSVECNGDVYLCPSLHKEDLILGNTKEKPLSQIKSESKKAFKGFRVDDLEGCKDCDFKYYCASGCRAIALNDTDNIYGVENNCPIYKERIMDLMVR